MWINLKISKTWIDVGVRLLISMNLLRKTRQIFHQSVLNLCFFCFKVWRHRARHHLELTRSSWSGPGRFGRSAPRRCGPFLPVNLVTTPSDNPPPPCIQSAVWTDDCKHLSQVDTISEIVLFFSLELFICISTFSQRSKQFALLHNCHVWINFRGRWDQF